MPERWERELGKLRSIEPSEGSIRDRVAGGARGGGLPSRRERAVAGIVAGIVAIAAIALVARTLPSDQGGVGSVELPTLTVSFHDSEVKAEGPDASYREVQTSIVYGDAVDRSFTSTTRENAIVEWVASEDLTRFVPGPTAGSLVSFEADGDDPRVLLGRPDDWPNFGRMERIDRLPGEPGEYLLVFVADYPEGIARTARVLEIVAQGTLQVDVRESASGKTTSASAYVDGQGVEGFLSSRRFTAGDMGMQVDPRAPTFGEDAWLPVLAGAELSLTSAVTEARAGWFRTYDDFRWDHPELPIDPMTGGSVAVEPGRTLLAVEAVWRHGKTGWANDGTEELAVFFFPIEVVEPAAEPSPAPPSPSPSLDGIITPSPTPSPSVAASDAILVRIEGLGRSERSRESPIMRVSFRGETALGCTEGFEWTTADGRRIDEATGRDGSSLPLCSSEPLFVVPPLTPIVVVSEEGTEVFAARTTTPLYPGTDGFGFSVRWPDGNADFTARYEVRSMDPVPKVIELGCAADDRIEFATPDGPRILPGGSAYIRGNMAGFLQTDVIEQMTRDPDGTTGSDGTWQVVRDGSVIAAVDFSSLSGIACRGSGIGGV